MPRDKHLLLFCILLFYASLGALVLSILLYVGYGETRYWLLPRPCLKAGLPAAAPAS